MWRTLKKPISAPRCLGLLRAKEAGVAGDDHVVAEIGQFLAGEIEGRRSRDEITVYKSIGHVVQDPASAWALYSRPE